MNILVTGACGQLGCEMRLASAISGHSWTFTDVCPLSDESAAMLRKLAKLSSIADDALPLGTDTLDITDPSAVRRLVEDRKIDLIVNCAAYTNVEAAEDNPDLAEKLNATAPGILAAAMAERGGLLVHISTDYVFGADPYNVPCREDQKGTPSGVYGLSKLHGEQAILASGCRSVILRTAWLYSEFGKNFCRTMLSLTASKPQISVVFDQAGTPTYARDLASAIMHIIAVPDAGGIYHYSNEGVCSWYDFTRMIAEISGQTACSVLPCHSDEFPSKVRRPAYSVLDKTLVKKTFPGIRVPYWTDSLRICISHLKG